MRYVSNEDCIENQNTRFMFNKFFFENRALIGIRGKYSTAGQSTRIYGNVTRCMRFACSVTKAKNTHSE